MAPKKKSNSPTTWKPTPEDQKIMAELKAKTGIVNVSDMIRIALRKYAQAEGIGQ